MKVPGKARWALVAMNTLVVVLALPSTMSAHVRAPFSPQHVDMMSLFVPMGQALANAKDVEACFGLPPVRQWIFYETRGFEGLFARESKLAIAKDIVSGLLPGQFACAGICAGRLHLRFATLRRPENVLHPFRAYPLPYPNEDVESPLTYRI